MNFGYADSYFYAFPLGIRVMARKRQEIHRRLVVSCI